MRKPTVPAANRFRPATADPGPATLRLERGSALSLHEQIFDRLRRELHQDLKPGAQVPTEEFLTRQYGVSRSTLRKAFERLVNEGVLVRHRGKGTYMARPVPQIMHPIDRLAPFFDTFKQLGGDIRVEVSQFAWSDNVELPAEAGEWPRPVLTYEWRYFSRDVPHAITRTRLPQAVGRRLTQDDVMHRPVYELLQKKLKIKLAQAKFIVSCRPPSAQEAAALEVSQSAYVLVLDRVTRDDKGNPVEATTHVLRPDVYQLSVALDDLQAYPRKG